MSVSSKSFIYGILIILFLVIMFVFSNQNGLTSNEITMTIAKEIREFVLPVSGGTYIKLVKEESIITGYYSDNGENWIEIGKLPNISKDDGAYIGLAVSSLDNKKLCSAVFSNVKIKLEHEGVQEFRPSANKDIGQVGLKGSVILNDGVFTINGSGKDIWNGEDEFHFAYIKIKGNCSITAKIDSIQNTNVNAKAGVMIRNTLEPSSHFADVIITPMKQVYFQWRNENGISCIAKTYGKNLLNINSINFLVRKVCHFIEFLILSLFVYKGFTLVKVSNRRRYIITFIFCLVFATTDEIHQIFVPNRTPSLLDVFIDASGVAFRWSYIFKKLLKTN